MRKSMLLAGLLLACVCRAAAQSSADPRKCFKSQADADKIIESCSAAINSSEISHTDYVQALYNRGNAYVSKHDLNHAIDDYSKVIASNPETEDANIFNNRGLAYLMNKDYDHAIPDFMHAVHLNPRDPYPMLSLSRAHEFKGDYDQAIQDFTDILRENKHLAMAYVYRGEAYTNKGDYDQAIEDFSQVIHWNPKSANAFVKREEAYWRKGDYDNAVQDLTKAFQLLKGFPPAIDLRGMIYYTKGDYDLAIQDYDQARIDSSSGANAWVRGLAFYSKGDLDHAIQDFSHSASDQSTNAGYGVLLLFLARSRAGADARDELKKNSAARDLTKWPGPIVRFYLGEATSDDVLQAAHDADREKNAKQACDANFYLAEYSILQGNRAEAIPMLRKTPDICRPDFLVYRAALAELARLEKAP